jgi:surfactin synthase thioesterase subunit
MAEPAIAEASVLTPMLLEALRPHLGQRYALFGHSLGAMLAFALARAVKDRGLPSPEMVVLAACSPESIQPAAPPRATWSDERLTEYVRRLGGTPDQMLADAELRALVLPRLRADFSLVDTLFPLTAGNVDCSIIAFAGERDRGVPAKQIKAWRERTTGSFFFHVLSGDHFFPTQPAAAKQMLEIAWRELQRPPVQRRLQS